MEALRNGWLNLTSEERRDFVAYQCSEGLVEALQDAKYLEIEQNEEGCLNFLHIPPSDDPYRPTPSIDGPTIAEAKKMLRKTFIVSKPNGGLFFWQRTGYYTTGDAVLSESDIRKSIAGTHPDGTILNDLPIEEARSFLVDTEGA